MGGHGAINSDVNLMVSSPELARVGGLHDMDGRSMRHC
jgi:hypothetical protein